MRVLALLLLVSSAVAQAPQVQLPYTPSLDTTAMDRSADPCEDFYQYACGGWRKNNPIPADQASWSAYAKMQNDTREVLRRVLESAAASPHGAKQRIGDWYASFMDEKAVEAAGLKPLQARLARIAAIRDLQGMAKYLAAFHPTDITVYFGNSALFAFSSGQDAKNSQQVIGDLDQGGIGLPDRDYYTKGDERSTALREQYRKHVAKMLELSGESAQMAAADAETVLRIETALSKGSQTRVARRDPNNTYHRMTVAEVEKLAPAFPWRTYFKAIGAGDNPPLNVDSPEFLKELNEKLKAEPLDAWKAYLRWHLLHAQARYLPAAFVNEDFEFYGKTLTGQRELQPRWKRAVRFIDWVLRDDLAKAYVELTFSPELKQRTVKMVQQIEAAMGRDLEQLTWMSQETKLQALEKLHTVANKIGYPDRWRDYSGYKVVRGDVLGNGERGNAYEYHRILNKIGKPVDRGEWMISAALVNANYNPQMNDMTFPAAQLQPPSFDPKLDDAPSYGNIGATIGHELTHGFDDEGRRFDAQGNLRDWWTAQDSAEFESRAACIRDQYAQYVVVDDVHINSKLTLGEDVADVGGLILAWMAWRDETANQPLPDRDGLTPAQRFFVGYGQSWCGNQRPEMLRMRATTDPHSPERWRTNGVVVNVPEFQQAFQCKTGQAMAPEKRCRVW